jgi:lipase chaperone LimK
LIACAVVVLVAPQSQTAPAAAKKAEAAKPTAEEIAKLDAEVGLSSEQKTKVEGLLSELKQKRRAIKEDASLSDEQKKAKTKAINEDILGKDGKIKALMTAEQFAKWQKLQDAIRAARK